MNSARTVLDMRAPARLVPESGPLDFEPVTDAEFRRVRYWIERKVHGNDHAMAARLADLSVADRNVAAGVDS